MRVRLVDATECADIGDEVVFAGTKQSKVLSQSILVK